MITQLINEIGKVYPEITQFFKL